MLAVIRIGAQVNALEHALFYYPLSNNFNQNNHSVVSVC